MADLIVVDDDPQVRAVVHVILSEGGHDVRVAESAEDALLRSAERRADLLLLDLSLPGIDGEQFLAWLDRGIGRPRSVIIISGRDEADVREVAGRYGATYLAKPFEPDELQDVVTATLQMAAADARPAD